MFKYNLEFPDKLSEFQSTFDIVATIFVYILNTNQEKGLACTMIIEKTIKLYEG